MVQKGTKMVQKYCVNRFEIGRGRHFGVDLLYENVSFNYTVWVMVQNFLLVVQNGTKMLDKFY